MINLNAGKTDSCYQWRITFSYRWEKLLRCSLCPQQPTVGATATGSKSNTGMLNLLGILGFRDYYWSFTA